MRLLIARPSPFARKVRIALREKAIACDEMIDNPWAPDTAVGSVNPLGKVPVLVSCSVNSLHFCVTPGVQMPGLRAES